jgi:hypothetical protein
MKLLLTRHCHHGTEVEWMLPGNALFSSPSLHSLLFSVLFALLTINNYNCELGVCTGSPTTPGLPPQMSNLWGLGRGKKVFILTPSDVLIDKQVFISFKERAKSRGNAVGIATGCSLDDQGIGVRIQIVSRTVIYSYRPDPILGSTLPTIQCVLIALSPGTKRQ